MNDRYLKSLTPPSAGRLEVSDSKRVGLRFRLSASGRATWVYEKRVKGGQKRKHTFGAWPEPVSLSDARRMALEIELEASQGRDRVAEAETSRLVLEAATASAVTIQRLIDIYNEMHLSTLRRGAERKRQIEQSLAPKLSLPASSLVRSDLQKAVDAKATAGRGVFANRIRSALMAFTRWATERDYLESDIGAGLARPMKEVSRDRTPNVREVRQIWAATTLMGSLWGPALRLLILTAQRRHEILGLEWSEVDLQRATITKSGTRTKNGQGHITHLSKPALAELTALAKRRDPAAPTDLIFTTTGKTPISGVSKAKSRLDGLLGDGFEPWRLHDLRGAFATALVEAGVPESVADRVLNHSAVGSAPSTVARIYNRAEQMPQRAEALDHWAEIVVGENNLTDLVRDAI
ncbi:integrase [Octadecabacter antarcticus 307]|uniref:Integrase n=1 Tax=Octadecabacter antarcticus 307 TaxID=391626 RepID=M9R469_9RHOB|nr:integrase [Octadecabacter antarcticus 307]